MVRFTDTTLRDAHQSLWATRLKTDEMLPILKELDEAGFYSLEVWGGATFDVSLRYLNEDPWERLRRIKSEVKNTPLQMLVRGQNLVGYKHYSDDVVDSFIGKAVDNGIDIIRTFDALNDLRNLEKVISAGKREGAHVQGAIVYTISPIHKMEYNIELAKRLADMGVNSLAIKDMAGLLTPYDAFHLVKKLKEETGLMIQLHSHYTSGMAAMTYLKGIEAGADIVDTAVASMALHTSQPAAETMVAVLKNTKYDTGMDIKKLSIVSEYFETLAEEKAYNRPKQGLIDIKVLSHQVPGGMISNLLSQLDQQGAGDRIDDVLAELPRVRKDLGYPPLVTPTSQFVGTQAVLNVLLGERYKIVPEEVKNYIKGYYGTAPGEINPLLKKKIIKNEGIINVRPADLLEPAMEKAKEELPKELVTQEEDYLSYAMFPQITLKYLTLKHDPTAGDLIMGGDEDMRINIEILKQLAESLEENSVGELVLETKTGKVVLKRNTKSPVQTVATQQQVIQEPVAVAVEEATPVQTQESIDEDKYTKVLSPMVGTFYASPAPDVDPFVKEGDIVKKGDTLAIVEAMKLMNEVKSEVSGKVVKILAENSKPVRQGDVLMLIEE
ncbi:acetyl-CoA carboxylase biotin carboxyl carrier protein [Haliovirga abyssi]|uniref:Pyruvate carboxylase subunit B n=1 Tax=Haliovirga abyssi TaxID=2996794 RepID=A0AAU9D955_9FUSO|nr:acetyl-CoA carboxylase biotin carboxyl carrier protein [Haliovirga abyssi]BDU49810.1 pyruvate carboxylase subunit B [Haliovirga abyssi]